MKFLRHVNSRFKKEPWNLIDVNNKCHEHNIMRKLSDSHYVN